MDLTPPMRQNRSHTSRRLAEKSSETVSSHGRKRARRACIPCRKRKRKCDGNHPCRMCNNYGYVCSFTPDNSSLEQFAASTLSGAREQSSRSQATVGVTSGKALLDLDTGVFDEEKSRYVGSSSAVAFARVFGLELGSKSPLVLHSFGFNFGIRQEESSTTHGHLMDLLSETELKAFSDVYFRVCAPCIDVLDQDNYRHRCRDYYQEHHHIGSFAAVAGGVAAIGSFFSRDNGHPRELEIVQFAKAILEDAASVRRPTVDLVVGWILRFFYLRSTTRPNNAWLASSTTMHLAEAIGLHKEENVNRLAAVPGTVSRGHDAERLRRIFWTAWSCHIATSYEYGRSSIEIPMVTCNNTTLLPGPYSYQWICLIQIIPSRSSPFIPESEPRQAGDELVERIKALHRLPTGHAFLSWTKADLMCCFYRRLRQQRVALTRDVVEQIVTAGNEAVAAAQRVVVDEGYPFFNALGSVFQFSCVLLALDTPYALANVASVFSVLEAMANAIGTKMTREALSTAHQLLRDCVMRKRHDIAVLESVDAYADTGVGDGDGDDGCDDDGDANRRTTPKEADGIVDELYSQDLDLWWDTFFDDLCVQAPDASSVPMMLA
ncbi:uncharacterized protein BP5553_05667 [Venustampulla echinocandica]|uniref:Zn(2)-C6 fungal-type domain-containing protein n=1 Tax=Venustampulla echinocandica TaxID=2656787 RepID=A0A370TLB9_9HELO|nr:uncharacterized protein BP5553_05667 [Venustampulla echinocandica]RDL36315.1 hypothetical protein BP5553_05667 [Venustampulla echinocandica]